MIRLENLSKTYRSRDRVVNVIQNLTQDIPAGSFFTLLGPSGCGKTTTLRVIAGLERHDAGKVWFGDELISDPVQGLFTSTSQRDIGMVFQSYAIWPHMDVAQNVAYPLTTGRSKLDRTAIEAQVKAAVELVGLGAQLHAPATALSGGQQQRVALARALVARPKVLLLDEPLSNLDALLRERMRQELTELQKKVSVTAVYVTHDRAEALSMSDYIAVMNQGRIEMTGSPREVYTKPKTVFVAQFLGHCNFIDARVNEMIDAQVGVAQTEFGFTKVRMNALAKPGEAIKLLIRPEDLRTIANDEPEVSGKLSIRAQLGNSMYFGENFETDVVAGQYRLRYKSSDFAGAAGSIVRLTLRQSECWAFPAGAL